MNEYWYNTAKDFKFFMLNGNTLFFVLFWALHMAMWTFLLGLISSIIFTILESKGHSLHSFFSSLRLKIALLLNNNNTIRVSY
jgi:ABC-type phosphate/phosphonate transport system permease subunit